MAVNDIKTQNSHFVSMTSFYNRPPLPTNLNVFKNGPALLFASLKIFIQIERTWKDLNQYTCRQWSGSVTHGNETVTYNNYNLDMYTVGESYRSIKILTIFKTIL